MESTIPCKIGFAKRSRFKNKKSMCRSRLVTAFPCKVMFLLLMLAGCDDSKKQSVKQPDSEKEAVRAAQKPEVGGVPTLIAAEDLCLDLGLKLGQFGRGVVHSGQNDLDSDFLSNLAASSCVSVEFEGAEGSPGTLSTCGLAQHTSLDGVKASTGNPLQSLLSRFSKLSSIKFGILSGTYLDAAKNRFELEAIVRGSGWSQSGEPVGFEGKQQLIWRKLLGHWELVEWHVTSVKITRANQTLFRDVTAQAIPVKQQLHDAQRSVHFERISQLVETGKVPDFGKYTPFIDAAFPHGLPSVSVFDLNSDSNEDFFISSRLGRTQFFQNSGDGTFQERTQAVGLDFDSLVNCSSFVDVDNDGDLDALIGRSLEPMVFLRNDNGVFIDVTQSKSNLSNRFMVSAVSASDINRDGLIDFYCSTYGPFGQNKKGSFKESSDWKDRFLSREDARKLMGKHVYGHGYVDNAGPPNFIIMNRGNGTLEAVNVGEVVEQWHHSYQSAWCDIDGDGDDDVYVANDFARDAILINETPRGATEPTFSDGLEAVFPGGGIGFGMGASWDDFDSDGDIDLYVSNMYSKAGARILRQLQPGDERFEIATRGNFLYRNTGGELENVAGKVAGKQDVGRVGWSYGGQFFDADNNGFSDIYVPSGYFSAIPAVDTKVDI